MLFVQRKTGSTGLNTSVVCVSFMFVKMVQAETRDNVIQYMRSMEFITMISGLLLKSRPEFGVLRGLSPL